LKIMISLRLRESAVISVLEVMRYTKIYKGMMMIGRLFFRGQRMKYFTDSLAAEPTREGLLAAEIPEYMVDGLLVSRNHYGEIDTENYTLNIMQALDIAEGRMEAASQPVAAPTPPSDSVEGEAASGGESEVKDTILSIIEQLDQGDGVDFETVLTNAVSRGFDRGLAEEKLDELSNEGTLHEPRFGWFRIVG